MNKNYKPGGGNKPQLYISAGNGKESGEYTKKPTKNIKVETFNCHIVNKRNDCNFLDSKLVKATNQHYTCTKGCNVPCKFIPNSVIKKVINGYVVTERFFDKNGLAYLDIDYTCHGNPSQHKNVPHIHKWERDENGNIFRMKGEKFQ